MKQQNGNLEFNKIENINCIEDNEYLNNSFF